MRCSLPIGLRFEANLSICLCFSSRLCLLCFHHLCRRRCRSSRCRPRGYRGHAASATARLDSGCRFHWKDLCKPEF
eukprot:3333590-Pleurochrysis_carterae.AAC.3